MMLETFMSCFHFRRTGLHYNDLPATNNITVTEYNLYNIKKYSYLRIKRYKAKMSTLWPNRMSEWVGNFECEITHQNIPIELTIQCGVFTCMRSILFINMHYSDKTQISPSAATNPVLPWHHHFHISLNLTIKLTQSLNPNHILNYNFSLSSSHFLQCFFFSLQQYISTYICNMY